MNIRRTAGLLCVLLLLALGLAACGGEGDGGGESAKQPLPCYALDSLRMGDTEYDSEQIKELLGVEDPAEFMAVYLSPGGKMALAMQDGFGVGTWEEVDGNYEAKVTLGEEERTFTFVKEGEDTLILDLEESGDEGTFVFKQTDEIPGILAKDPMLFFDVSYDAAKRDAMNTAMLGGAYYFDGMDIYGHFFKDKAACLGMVTGGEGTSVSELTVLDENCIPNYVSVAGDYVYYLRTDRDDDSDKRVCRIKKSGGKPETLYEGSAAYVQVVGDNLYFTDKDNKMVMADLEGQNSTVILDKEVFYAYWLTEDWLLYQDDADKESLHLYYAPLGADKQLTDTRSLCPVLDGTTLWYAKDEGADGKDCRLAKLDLGTMKEEVSEKNLGDGAFLMEAGNIYLGAWNEQPTWNYQPKDKWQELAGLGEIDWETYPWSEQKAVSDKHHLTWENEGNGIKIIYWNGAMGGSI